MNVKYQFINLLNKLYDITGEGLIEWSLDNDEFDTAYKCDVSGSTISILETTNARNEPLIQVSIRSGGKTMDTFTDEMFRGMMPDRGGHGSYWEFMTELSQMARRNANKSDAILRGILADLNAQFPEENEPF